METFTKWLGDQFTSNGFSVFVGAFLGAFAGYLFQRFQDWQERSARRADLFDLLHREYELLADELPPFDASLVRYLDPVDLHAGTLLLESDAVSYSKDQFLVRG